MNIYIDEIIQIAQEAGKLVMKQYGIIEDLGKTVKTEAYADETAHNKAALSQVDLDCQKHILERLVLNHHEKGVYAEEEDKEILEIGKKFAHFGELKQEKYTFIIDPIDGTKNFLSTNPKYKKGTPENKDKFGVCINIAYGYDIIAGVMHFPALNTTISTEKGNGTYINGKRIKITKKTEQSFDDPVRISASINEIKPLFRNTKSFGSSCYNLLALLREEINAYIMKSVDLLDFGCSAVAYEEAGGIFCDAKLENVSVPQIIQNEQGIIKLKGFGLLGPTKEYCKAILETLNSKGYLV